MLRFVKVDNTLKLCQALNLRLYSKQCLFNPKILQKIHEDRKDRAYSFDKLKLTRESCSVSIFKNVITDEYFIKFGCIFILETKRLFELKKKDSYKFLRTLINEFTSQHFNEYGTRKISQGYKEYYFYLKNLIEGA